MVGKDTHTKQRQFRAKTVNTSNDRLYKGPFAVYLDGGFEKSQ